jgi:hypothetical protein
MGDPKWQTIIDAESACMSRRADVAEFRGAEKDAEDAARVAAPREPTNG